MLKKIFVSLFVMTLFLAGCQAESPQPEEPTQTTPSVPPNAIVLFTPSPLIETVPSPSNDLTTVTGVLMMSPNDPKPVAGALLYLAEVIETDAGVPGLAGFDRNNSPKTITDPYGRFVFEDVEAKGYALIFDRVHDSFMLQHPQTGEDMLFYPETGKVLDVGELVYASLPGQNGNE